METEHFTYGLMRLVGLHAPIGPPVTGLATVRMHAAVCHARQLVA
jgi:hypothetical protein